MSDLESLTSYDPVRATTTMRNMPRFGHSSNFANLFSKVDNEPQDYGKGLLFGGIMIISFFFAWSILLLLFKCLGQRRVGFLSGAPFTKPSSLEKEYKRPFRCRVTFMISGVCVILFGVLLVTHGVTNVRETIDTLDRSNKEVTALVNDANEIAESLRSIGESTQAVRNELVSYLGNFCPDEPNVEAATGFDFDVLAGQAIDLLNTLGDFLGQELVTVEDTLETANDTTTDIDDGVENIDINDWQALIILIPLIIIPSILMVGTLMAWYEVSSPIFSCILNWFILPLFIIISIGAYVGSGGVAIAAVVNADWCSGNSEFVDSGLQFSGAGTSLPTPDNTILDILRNQEVDKDSLVFRAVAFYITQCRSDDPWDFIRQYTDEVEEARTQVRELFDAVEDVGIAELSVVCGRDFGPLDILLQTIRNDLEILFENAASVIDLLRCTRIVPIYTHAVYEGTCTYSVTGITWVWAALLVIAFGSFVMLTLRASWAETVFDEDDVILKEVVDEYPEPEKTFEDDVGNSPAAEEEYTYTEQFSGTPQDNQDVYSARDDEFHSQNHKAYAY